jgi:5'-nucleotidase
MTATPMPARKLVLLSNDDGHTSPGLRAMREALVRHGADVVVVAPETEQSASSHALSLHRPLRLRAASPGVFALDGTPADCVYLALYAGTRVLPRWPDVVVSGINHGMNLGQDAFYSGTVAAAREAAFRKIPALATSAHPALDLEPVAEVSARLALAMEATGQAALFNLNVPPGWNGGLRATRLGSRIYDELIEFRTDPRGREYVWLGGHAVRHERDPGSDTDAYDEGVASVTPLLLDLTNTGEAQLAASVVAAMMAPTGTKRE